MRSCLFLLIALPLLSIGCPQGERESPSTPAAPAANEAAFVEKVPPLPADARTLSVIVSDRGYEPAILEAAAKESVILAFTRTSASDCGRYVKVVGTDTQAALPLNETVKIPVEMPESGELTFACGMDMMHGVVKVVPVGAAPKGERPSSAPEGEPAKQPG